ncbi:MAG: LysM peptidoglycan-binding domain-containing protein [bacterium]|nr:LysM peptidoglycan-binding domain-containing protein [bacterium]
MKIFVFILLMSFMFTNFAMTDQIIQRHTVRKGETLSSLASKYNTSVEQIKKWNNFSSSRIYPGQNIIVGKYQAKSKVENVYVVKKGDSLSSISKKTGISVEDLKAYNNLDSDKLYTGQKLVLKKPEVQPIKDKKVQLAISTNQPDIQCYYVKKGDTLSSISRKSGVSVEEIRKLNNLKDTNIRIGQKLLLTPEEKIIQTETQQVVLLSDKEENEDNEEATTLPSKIIINKYHKIKKGETLSSIAKKHGTTVASIKKLNKLKTNIIQPGRTIIVARITKDIPPVVVNPTPIVTVSPKIYYNVKIGDTLESIAMKFGISVAALKETNLLSDGRIRVGQTLVIPQVADICETSNIDTSVSEIEKVDNGSKILAARIIESALNFINTPYRLGGLSRKGIDCSGLVKKSYEAAGICLPRTSREQAKEGEIVPISAIKPGDLLFFGKKGRINHVGIYIGDNKFIHASRESGKVVIANLDESYYQNHLICARTFVNGEQGYWIEEQ